MQTRSLALPETARHFLIIIERYLFVSDCISISNIRKYTRQMSSIIKANIIIPFLLSSDGFWAEIAITHAHLLKNLPTCKLRKKLNKYIHILLFPTLQHHFPKCASKGNARKLYGKLIHGRATQAQNFENRTGTKSSMPKNSVPILSRIACISLKSNAKKIINL